MTKHIIYFQPMVKFIELKSRVDMNLTENEVNKV